MIRSFLATFALLAITAFGAAFLTGCGGSGTGPSEASGELEPYQANVVVEPSEANIGDRVKITIETLHPPGSEVLNARLTINTNLFVFGGVNPRMTQPFKGNRLTRQSFVATYFELGEVQAASGHVVCIHTNSPDQYIEVPSQAVHFVSILNAAEQELDVATGVVVAADSELYSARREFFRETAEAPWDRSTGVIPVVAWLFIMLGLLSMLVLLLYFAFRSGKRREEPRRATFTAVQLARRELRALKQSRHAEEGRVEPFYVELSGIARRYLERQFHLNAPEQTTEEFLHDLARDNRLESDQKELLGRFLNESDLVKFARATPTMENMEDAFNAAERLVEETQSKTIGYTEKYTEGSLDPVAPPPGPASAPTGHRAPSAGKASAYNRPPPAKRPPPAASGKKPPPPPAKGAKKPPPPPPPPAKGAKKPPPVPADAPKRGRS